ncbi:MAG: MBL fold metallo-hydrolase [Thermoplasmatota archaeon]
MSRPTPPRTFHERMTHEPPSALAKLIECAWFWGHHGPWRRVRRKSAVPVAVQARNSLAPARPGALRVTWVGHATTVVQIGGKTLVLDPVWSEALPGGIRRMTPPGVAWAGMPAIDGVLVSHNHYDHLDLPSLRRLPPATPIFVPHGVGAWLRSKGFANVTELDWHQAVPLGELTITLVPAHHWSRRGWRDANRTLWGGWIVKGPDGRQAYFAGDTGYGHFFREIGERHPGIDVAILPIGAYAPKRYNGGAHMDPEQAVRAFKELGARVMVPVHWGTFRLSPEPVAEPMQWLQEAWTASGLERSRLWDLAIGGSRALDEPAPEPHVPIPAAPPATMMETLASLVPGPPMSATPQPTASTRA